MSILYGAFARDTLAPDQISSQKVDLFVSARNDSDRVLGLFREICAVRKVWFEHAEYALTDESSVPFDLVVRSESDDYVEQMLSLVEALSLEGDAKLSRLGIDITGFMRIQLMVLLRLIMERFEGELVLFYSDPESYESGTDTKFSSGALAHVIGVPGYEGIHENGPDASDMLIIGAGYDYRVVRRVASSRKLAQHRLMWGLPSLQPHMYAESQLQLAKTREAINGFESERISLYAPAGDPFATAQVLSAFVARIRRAHPDLNLYLSPTGTKTQVLGFALFALLEQQGSATTMVYAPSAGYSPETATGWARSHRFELTANIVSSIQRSSLR